MSFLNVPDPKPRQRRRSIATPGALITIPDNDEPVDFANEENFDEAALRKMIQKQNKRRGSCPLNPQVREFEMFALKIIKGGFHLYPCNSNMTL